MAHDDILFSITFRFLHAWLVVNWSTITFRLRPNQSSMKRFIWRWKKIINSWIQHFPFLKMWLRKRKGKCYLKLNVSLPSSDRWFAGTLRFIRLLPSQPKGWRVRKKTHASSPSTSGKTHEKTCPIQTRLETRDWTRRWVHESSDRWFAGTLRFIRLLPSQPKGWRVRKKDNVWILVSRPAGGSRSCFFFSFLFFQM